MKRHVASTPELTAEEARREAEEAAARQRQYELQMMQESTRQTIGFMTSVIQDDLTLDFVDLHS